MDFKIGEVWEEISNELNYEGIRAVSPDLENIQTSRAMVKKKALAVQTRQKEIARKTDEVMNLHSVIYNLQKEMEEDRKFYRGFIDSLSNFRFDSTFIN